ncbi:MAG: hypothetical protein AAFV90_24845 [Cyanobacteria bacterium J06634_5]
MREKVLGIQKTFPPEALIAFETLSERYPIPSKVLWDCLFALKLEPQIINGKPYFTASHLKRLEQFIGRIELVWHCPHVLAIRYR